MALGVMVFTSPQALADDPELSFYPAGQWTVSKGAMCSISAEFNNGFVMQFDGATDGLQSMSIDFRQAAFEAGKDYKIKLSVPGLVEKTVSGQAGDGQVLRLDMKGHDDVLYAMGKSSILDLGIEDNHFRFYMVGYVEDSKDFNSCMNIKAGVETLADAKGEATYADVKANRAHVAAEENIVVSTSRLPPDTVVPPAPEDEAAPPSEPVEMGKAGGKAGEKSADDAKMKYVFKGEDKSDLGYLGIEEDSKVKVSREKYEVQADFTGAKDVSKLKNENASLKNELQSALDEQRSEQLSISAENWDLERATARYNEAELQIKTLGQKLQRERTQCTMEKKELETMLFDPQVTSTQQQAKLAELEEQLMNAQKELDLQRVRYDERIKVLESQLQAQ